MRQLNGSIRLKIHSRDEVVPMAATELKLHHRSHTSEISRRSATPHGFCLSLCLRFFPSSHNNMGPPRTLGSLANEHRHGR